MSFSLSSVFSMRNLNLVVGLLTMLLVAWLVMLVIPDLFISLFHSWLGNLAMLVFIFLCAMYDINLAGGVFVVFVVLWRLSHSY